MSPVDTPQLFDLWMCGETTSAAADRSNNSMTGGGGSINRRLPDKHIAGIFLLLPVFDKPLEYRLSV
jgi:hypothetical protein